MILFPSTLLVVVLLGLLALAILVGALWLIWRAFRRRPIVVRDTDGERRDGVRLEVVKQSVRAALGDVERRSPVSVPEPNRL